MDIGWKIASAVALGIAGAASSKIAEAGWQLVTGHKPPREDEDGVALVQLIVFAALSAALGAVVQRFALRGAKRWWGRGASS